MIKFIRRHILGLMAAAIIALVASPGMAATKFVDYTPTVLADAKASGEAFLLDFYASWCATCKAQDRVLGELQVENPDYASVLIIRVDWDLEKRGPLVAEMAIPRRSTLVLMRGETELVRIVAQANKDDMARMLDKAL